MEHRESGLRPRASRSRFVSVLGRSRLVSELDSSKSRERLRAVSNPCTLLMFRLRASRFDRVSMSCSVNGPTGLFKASRTAAFRFGSGMETSCALAANRKPAEMSAAIRRKAVLLSIFMGIGGLNAASVPQTGWDYRPRFSPEQPTNSIAPIGKNGSNMNRLISTPHSPRNPPLLSAQRLSRTEAAVIGLFLIARTVLAADFAVTSPGFFYAINGNQPNPTLTLVRGRTYTFAVNSSSIHPFEILRDRKSVV